LGGGNACHNPGVDASILVGFCRNPHQMDDRTLRRCERIRVLFNRKLAKLNPDDPTSSRDLAGFYWMNRRPLDLLVEHYKRQISMPADVAAIRRIAHFETQMLEEEKRLRANEQGEKLTLVAEGDGADTKGNPDGEIELANQN